MDSSWDSFVVTQAVVHTRSHRRSEDRAWAVVAAHYERQLKFFIVFLMREICVSSSSSSLWIRFDMH